MSRLGGEKEEDVDSLKKVVIRTYLLSPPFLLWCNPPCSPRHMMHPLPPSVYYYSLLAAGNGGEEKAGGTTWGRTKIRPSDKEIAIANHGQVRADPVSHIIAPRISIFFRI